MATVNKNKVEMVEEIDKALDTNDPEVMYNNLENVYKKRGIKMPWGDQDPDEFFSNRDNQLVFE